MTSQALAIKPPSSSPGYQREISRRATGRGVDRRPAGQVTTHWKLSPAGRLVARLDASTSTKRGRNACLLGGSQGA